jgi:hypothetical protein
MPSRPSAANATVVDALALLAQRDTTTLILIIVLVILLFGGGWYGRGCWY